MTIVGTLAFVVNEVAAWRALTRGVTHLTYTVTDHSGLQLLRTNCKGQRGKRCTYPGERQQWLKAESQQIWLWGDDRKSRETDDSDGLGLNN